MKTQRRKTRTGACLLITALMCLCSLALAKTAKLPVEPDLTKGEKPSGNYVAWTLCTTGATGQTLEDFFPAFDQALVMLRKIDPSNVHMINHVGKDFVPALNKLKSNPKRGLKSIAEFIKLHPTP